MACRLIRAVFSSKAMAKSSELEMVVFRVVVQTEMIERQVKPGRGRRHIPRSQEQSRMLDMVGLRRIAAAHIRLWHPLRGGKGLP